MCLPRLVFIDKYSKRIWQRRLVLLGLYQPIARAQPCNGLKINFREMALFLARANQVALVLHHLQNSEKRLCFFREKGLDH